MILKVSLLRVSIFSVIIGDGIAVAFRDLFHNIISGLILKWDQSLKIGNTIQWGYNRTGTISEINLRYTLLYDRNNLEIILPNSYLLSGPIVNLTKSDPYVRLTGVKIPIPHNIKYEELENLMKEFENCLIGVKRIENYGTRVSKAFLHEHNSYATIIEVRFWIKDPENGIANIKSEVLKKCTKILCDNFYIPTQKYIFNHTT